MKITEFAFVGHPVESMKRAQKFYEEVLRLPPPKVLGKGWFEYEIGPYTLAITTAWSDNKPPERPSCGLALEVEDFDEAI